MSKNRDDWNVIDVENFYDPILRDEEILELDYDYIQKALEAAELEIKKVMREFQKVEERAGL